MDSKPHDPDPELWGRERVMWRAPFECSDSARLTGGMRNHIFFICLYVTTMLPQNTILKPDRVAPSVKVYIS